MNNNTLKKNISIKEISYAEILPLWQDALWPNRPSPIRPVSSMLFLGGYDLAIYTNALPTFWGLFDGHKLIGVNSGFATSAIHWRSRGLWIDPKYRGQQLSQLLLRHTINAGQTKQLAWSFPRQTALGCYLAVGFKQCSPWIDSGEFGPNCYVSFDYDQHYMRRESTVQV